MIQRTLIPLDGSEASDLAIDHAARLARRVGGAHEQLTLLRVVPPFASSGEDALRLRVAAAERALEEHVTRLRSRGVHAAVKVRVGEPEAAIKDIVEELRPTRIAMATHGRRGPARWIQGSIAEDVLRESDVPLLLVNARRCAPANLLPYGKVLLPLDGSPASEAALELLVQLAPQPRPHVVLCRFAQLHVAAGPWPLTPAATVARHDTDDLQEALGPAAARLEQAGFPTSLRVAYGDPTELILSTLEREAVELVVMATHGAAGLERLLCGSVTESVLRRAPCPLLVTRTGSREETP